MSTMLGDIQKEETSQILRVGCIAQLRGAAIGQMMVDGRRKQGVPKLSFHLTLEQDFRILLRFD